MQIQPTIQTLDTPQLVVDLPASFAQRRVEVLVITIDEPEPKPAKKRRIPPPQLAGQVKELGDVHCFGNRLGTNCMIVLDTHIRHWWLNQIPGKLSPEIIALIEEADAVSVSAISCFEMAWFVRHGRIDLNMPFERWFNQIEYSTDIRILPVTAQIAIRAMTLPEHHKDPQDRIIIATALLYDARLLSFDSAFPAYRELDGRLLGH